ncbi:MAG: methylmalonyl Co-A mutase-associated GTPase MeaB [Arenicellales bacterium]
MNSTPSPRPGEDGLLDRLRNDRATLARALTAVESGIGAAHVLHAIQPALGRARTVGITGAPGAGKSTLINKLIGALRRRGETVAVVAVDPSSPFSGGSILGDRVRMTDHQTDDGVFVRSVASRGSFGGLSLGTARLMDVFDAAGYDWVIVETVGAGQSEVEIADLAQATVVVCAPGLGDDVQAIKAGILEIADVIVVNKADHPHADATIEQLRSAVTLRRQRADVKVLATVATTGQGVDELLAVLLAQDYSPSKRGALERIRKLIARSAGRHLERKLMKDPSIEELCRRVQSGELDPESAAEELVGHDG